MTAQPKTYSILGRLLWLPLLSAPIAVHFIRILLPAITIGFGSALLLGIDVGIKMGFIGFIVASWCLAFTYGGSSISKRFWRTASKYPEAAYQWFTAESCWQIADTRPSAEWCGPFKLYVPSIGKMVCVYGRIPDYEQSQRSFLVQVSAHEEKQA